jgi:hypothetical protein
MKHATMNLHNVTAIRTREVVGKHDPNLRWTEVAFISGDSTFNVTVFGDDSRSPVGVDVTTLEQ